MPSVLASPRAHELLGLTGTEMVVKKLNKFGLREKEAQLYVHLLKYGPKRAGDLARSLKTHRLDVYRKLAGLSDKALVTAKRESPAVYSAVDLAEALDAVLASRQRELRLMENLKRELVVVAKGTHRLTADDAFAPKSPANNNEQMLAQLLNAFGLREKEAQLYVHLLKYGPKRAGDLARSLKTYRGDVYRRCARLAEEGLVSKGIEDSARFVPVELGEALEAALGAHQQELRRLERAKKALVEDANATLRRGPGYAHAFKMLRTVGEVVTAISQLINSAETSVVFVAQQRFNLLSMGGFLNHLKCAIGRGALVLGVLDISHRNLSAGRAYINCGVELRHINPYSGITTVMADGKQSISLLHADMKSALSLDENIEAIWSNSPAQAEFLTSAFEMAWEQSIGAEERINELLRQERSSSKSASTT